VKPIKGSGCSYYESRCLSCQPIFDSIVKRAVAFELVKASLHLIGFGQRPSSIDLRIKHLIHFHDMLDVDAFWATLSSSLAIAPASANNQYLTNKASSIIPTALVVGVPLICDRETLDLYSYLNEEDVWLLEPRETVADSFLRVLRNGSTAWAKKRKTGVKRREKLEIENIRQVNKFLGRFVEQA